MTPMPKMTPQERAELDAFIRDNKAELKAAFESVLASLADSGHNVSIHSNGHTRRIKPRKD